MSAVPAAGGGRRLALALAATAATSTAATLAAAAALPGWLGPRGLLLLALVPAVAAPPALALPASRLVATGRLRARAALVLVALLQAGLVAAIVRFTAVGWRDLPAAAAAAWLGTPATDDDADGPDGADGPGSDGAPTGPATGPAPGPGADGAGLDADAVAAAAAPACVRVGRASGVNVAAAGFVLTNAHVVLPLARLDAEDEADAAEALAGLGEVAGALGAGWAMGLPVVFPDGRVYPGVTVAADAERDLALLRLEGLPGRPRPAALPWVRLAPGPAAPGSPVVLVAAERAADDRLRELARRFRADPEGFTPEPPPADPRELFAVRAGEVLGYAPGDRAGPQRPLGRLEHSATTTWGHSGGPLLDARGRVVGLHNTWDPASGARHAVTWEALDAFLQAAEAPVPGYGG